MNDIKKITYGELAAAFREHERTHTDGTHLRGAIVFTEDSFTKQYSLDARTYLLSSNNKAFIPGMGGYSIYASAKDGWKVDYCYLIEQ